MRPCTSTPILVPDGTFQFTEIAKRFRNRASLVDTKVATYIYEKLTEVDQF